MNYARRILNALVVGIIAYVVLRYVIRAPLESIDAFLLTCFFVALITIVEVVQPISPNNIESFRTRAENKEYDDILSKLDKIEAHCESIGYKPKGRVLDPEHKGNEEGKEPRQDNSANIYDSELESACEKVCETLSARKARRLARERVIDGAHNGFCPLCKNKGCPRCPTCPPDMGIEGIPFKDWDRSRFVRAF